MRPRTMKRMIIWAMALLLTATIPANAQSVSYAKSLIEQGRYLDAAKQLRPMADGGNAEAQYLAAILFFEGKGVTKNDAQGIKYATMSANQGNENAVMLLVSHYKAKGQLGNYFTTIQKYGNAHPYMLEGALGIMLAEAYFNGIGTTKNPIQGIKIVESNNLLNQFTIEQQTAYWQAKSQTAGCSSVQEYADYLFGKKEFKLHAKITEYIMNYYYGGNPRKLNRAGSSGNLSAWEMAHLANLHYKAEKLRTARYWAQKAVALNSNYGRAVQSWLDAAPTIYQISNYRSQARGPRITTVKNYEEKTEVLIHYSNNTGTQQRLTISPNTYINCGGRTYRMIGSSVPSGGAFIDNGGTLDITLTFSPIPSNWSTFDLIENGTWKFYEIVGSEK